MHLRAQHGGCDSWADRNPSQPQFLHLQPGRITSLTEDGMAGVRNSLWGRRKIPQAVSKKASFFLGLEAWARGSLCREAGSPFPTPGPAAFISRRSALMPSLRGTEEQSSG